MKTAPSLHFAGHYNIAGKPVFAPMSFDLPAGQWTCLLGPSGVGKSTILKLIAGLDAGGTFDGIMTASDGGPIAPRTCLMAQKDLLLPWRDVAGNIGLGNRLRGTQPDQNRIADLIDRVGLTPHAHKKPSALSGGMRQRVALARMLMEDRPIVLLDEPFSALDARTRADMQALAVETLKDRTVLLVTHDPAEAAILGHKVLVMQSDKIIDLPVPETHPIRAFEDPETLALRAELFALLQSEVI